MPFSHRDAEPLAHTPANDARYRRVFETADLGVVFHDRNGAIVDANPAAERMLGRTLDELRRLGPIEAPWPSPAHDERETGDPYPVHEVLRTGRPVHGAVFEVLRPNATRSLWLQAAARLDDGDHREQAPLVVVTLTDVTAHRQDREDLERQRRLEELLVEIATTYIHVPADGVGEAIHDTMERLGAFIGADRFYLFSYDWDANTTSNTHEWCAEGVPPEIDRLQGIPLDSIQPWARTHAAGRAMRVDDVAQLPHDDELRIILEPQGVQSLIAVPVMDGGSCVGFVGLDAVRERRDFSDSEERLLRVFAQMLANVRRRTPLADVLGGRGARGEA